jgi:hypothetical protein
MSAARPPRRPAFERAARKLCEAATPEAARAAASALDVQCENVLAPFDDMEPSLWLGAAATMVASHMRLPERVALTDMLLAAPASVCVALLRSNNTRHTNLAAALFSCDRLRTAPNTKTALGSGSVLRALLDALLATEAPAMRGIAAAGRAGSASGGEAAAAFDNLLCALSEALNTWPRTVERLAAAPQRDAVLRCVARLHKPLQRRADDGNGSLAGLHSSATTVLQSLSARERGTMLLWTNMHDTVRALVASLVAQVRAWRLGCVATALCLHSCGVWFALQGAAACKRPITTLYVPNEAACACTVLCNCISGLCLSKRADGAPAAAATAVPVPSLDPDAVLDELCAAGLPAALRALLHESSALLGAGKEATKALPPVIHLLFLLLQAGPRSRRALLTDEPDGGAALLLALFAVSEYHPHSRTDGTAPVAHLNAAYWALNVHTLMCQLESDGDSAAAHAIMALMTHIGVDADQVSDMDVVAPAQHAAVRRLAMRHGWDGSGAADGAAARRIRHNTACDVRAVGDCAGCGRLARAGERAFHKCGRCRVTPYCSRDCQTAHWKTHKRSCTAAPGTA